VLLNLPSCPRDKVGGKLPGQATALQVCNQGFVRGLGTKRGEERMNKAQLVKKLLKEKERDRQKAEFLQKNLAENEQNGVYNTPPVLYTKITCKVYKAGRTYLIRIPKSVVKGLELKPMDLITIKIEKAREGG